MRRTLLASKTPAASLQRPPSSSRDARDSRASETALLRYRTRSKYIRSTKHRKETTIRDLHVFVSYARWMCTCGHTENDLRCSIMSSRNDCCVVLVLERSAPEIDQTNVGVVQNPLRLSWCASGLQRRYQRVSSNCEDWTDFRRCVPVARIGEENILRLEIGMNEIDRMQDCANSSDLAVTSEMGNSQATLLRSCSAKLWM